MFSLLQENFFVKLEHNEIRSKMSLVYWWTHWFWITAIIVNHISATPVPLSSYETISTSLKSALVQNDNTFQQTEDQQKVVPGSRSVPLTFETSDTDDVFGGAAVIDAENSAKNEEWLIKPVDDTTRAPVHVKLEKSENVPSEVVASLSLPNVANSTNISSSQATTMLSSVTESIVVER